MKKFTLAQKKIMKAALTQWSLNRYEADSYEILAFTIQDELKFTTRFKNRGSGSMVFTNGVYDLIVSVAYGRHVPEYKLSQLMIGQESRLNSIKGDMFGLLMPVEVVTMKQHDILYMLMPASSYVEYDSPEGRLMTFMAPVIDESLSKIDLSSPLSIYEIAQRTSKELYQHHSRTFAEYVEDFKLYPLVSAIYMAYLRCHEQSYHWNPSSDDLVITPTGQVLLSGLVSSHINTPKKTAALHAARQAKEREQDLKLIGMVTDQLQSKSE